MRLHPYLSLALVPAALVAQAPAPTDFAAVQKKETPGIEGMLKDYQCLEALTQVEALLPPALPAFDKSSPTTAMKSSLSFSGLTRLYLLAGRAAVQAGEWEKALDYDTKAQDAAKVNYETTKEALSPLVATWTEAVEKAQAFVNDNGDRIKALKARPALTPAEEKEVQAFVDKDKEYNSTKDQKQKNEAATYLNTNKPRFLELRAKLLTPEEQQDIKNYDVAQDNLVRGPKTIKAIQDNIDAPKVEFDACQKRIDAASASIKAAEEEISKGLAEFKVKGKLVKETSGPKYDEKRSKYFESLLNTKSNYESRPNKIDQMNFLFRLRHNVAGTALVPKVDEVIARVRADQDPFPAEKKPTKGKKSK